jgi:hypothetical protein
VTKGDSSYRPIHLLGISTGIAWRVCAVESEID